ncbi:MULTISPECIES: tRNA adenosine(34) deaminase TadA [unclassified Collinsella]|uniref:tRNA adenosine(34) deaminase TadA n=1 Tax=unclassified Collinsella TaxID=2637548 RepID=UPI003F896655
MTITEIDEKFMREALAEARAAATVGEVPIGAVVVRAGEIVARAHNRRELDQDPSAHAEFLALCAAAQTLGRWRLSDCTVYVTLEPCCMCAGLMVNARVGRCVYGAADAKAGAVGSLYDLNADSRLNHRFNVTAGVLADECREVLSGYFAGLRGVDGAACGCGLSLEAHAVHAEALAGVGNLADETLNFGPVQRRPRRVLLAIDSFKGSVSSAQAEEAVAEGVRRVWPDAEVRALPLADGGEGTLDAIAARGGELSTCEVTGPLGDRVSARMLVDGEHESAVIEMAEAAGIGCSPCTESAALAATTYGVGELMLRAIRAGTKTIYIGLGGSATNDGGAGMLQALGARVVDDQGCDIASGLAGLEHVVSIDLAPALRALNGARVVVLSDVENPLVGRRGALAVFGGQKGLPTDDAEALYKYDSWMVGYGRLLDAAIVEAREQGLLRVPEGARTFGSVLGVPGAGAAGGLGAALLALGAELRSGVETVLDLIGFDECVHDADLVITGEGNMDEQSAAGKAPVGVARRAKRYGKSVVAVVGGRADNLDAVYGQGVDLVLPVCRKPMSLEEALGMQEAVANLACAGEGAARAYDLGRI